MDRILSEVNGDKWPGLGSEVNGDRWTGSCQGEGDRLD